MLDHTVDTMALMMASFTLDQIEQQLLKEDCFILAGALQKLQVDIGLQHQAISTGHFDSPEGLLKAPLENPLQDETVAQIKAFEPVNHERLKTLVTIQNMLPDGDLKNELKTLNDELAQSAPPRAVSAQPVKPDKLTPP